METIAHLFSSEKEALLLSESLLRLNLREIFIYLFSCFYLFEVYSGSQYVSFSSRQYIIIFPLVDS